MNNEQIKNCVNEIAKFLAVRDIDKLDCKELEKSIGIKKVDVLVLLGNAIPYTIKCAAEAYRNNLCNRILINGGIGHSTVILRNQIRKDERFDFIEVENRAEADIFFDIMTKVYNIPREIEEYYNMLKTLISDDNLYGNRETPPLRSNILQVQTLH